jgi:3-oxoadipate enol-lactonase
MVGESGSVDVEGGQIYFEQTGGGPPLVWIHAAIADRRMWNREFIEYAHEHALIRYDVRGLGRSTAATAPYSDTDDLLAVLDRTGTRRATLIGCSNGGRIAIDFAIAHPERVDQLVLVAPALGGFELSTDPEERETLQRGAEQMAAIQALYKSGDGEAALAGIRKFWCSAQSGASLDLVVEMLRDNLDEVFTDASAAHSKPLNPSAASRLGAISAPTLVLLGDKDAPEMRFFVDRVVAGIPGSVKKTVSGADHLINLSRPNQFDEVVRNFLSARA